MNTDIKNQANVTAKSDVNLDLQLREEFFLGAEKFANNPLHRFLKEDHPIEEKLKFVPRMLFFVLGFKDIMEMVRYTGALGEYEKEVNTHSDEDSHHWEWYLNDLAFMDVKFKNAKPIDLVKQIWESDSFEVRKTIYVFNSYVKKYEHPIIRMLLIEILEMTFDKFKDVIHPILKEADLYDQLDYFGQKHEEMEAGHSTTGHSDDEITHLIGLMPEENKAELVPIVNELFDQMYQMTANWAKI